MITRTEALVLRTLDYRETSRIATLFTRAQGKIGVLAKGARQPKSRFGATLQPMACIQAVYYYRPTRNLQLLSESSHAERFPRIAADLERITIGLRIMELVNALLQDEEPNPSVFNLCVTCMRALDSSEAFFANVLPFFQLHLATLLGFAPAIDRETLAAVPDEGGRLLLDSGSILIGARPSGQTVRGSRAALRAFGICARAELDVVLRMQLIPEARRDLLHLTETYLQYHVEDAYPTRSQDVLAQLQRPNTLQNPNAPS